MKKEKHFGRHGIDPTTARTQLILGLSAASYWTEPLLLANEGSIEVRAKFWMEIGDNATSRKTW
jgi:hypothetical protein